MTTRWISIRSRVLISQTIHPISEDWVDGFEFLTTPTPNKYHFNFRERSSSQVVSNITLDFSLTSDFSVPIAFPQNHMAMPRNTGYISNVRTSPEFRQRGLFKIGLRNVIHFASQIGIDKLVANVDPKNIISLNTFSDLGFAPIAKVFVFRLFNETIQIQRPLS